MVPIVVEEDSNFFEESSMADSVKNQSDRPIEIKNEEDLLSMIKAN